MSRSVDLCDRPLRLAGLRRVALNGWSGVVQVNSSVSAGGGCDAPERPHSDGLKLLRNVVHVGEATKGVAVADLRITVNGRDSDVESLQDWLRGEPEFRGHLGQGEAPGPDGAMGAV